MKTIIVLFFCVQSCLVQTAFSQCLGRIAPAGCAPAAAVATSGFPTPSNYALGAIAPTTGIGGFGYGVGIADYAYPGLGGYGGAYGLDGYGGACGLDSYGGVGEGNVAVAGELPVAGTTAVAGKVPIMGAVTFGGPIPAAGVVKISGNCACGCGNGPYISQFY